MNVKVIETKPLSIAAKWAALAPRLADRLVVNVQLVATVFGKMKGHVPKMIQLQNQWNARQAPKLNSVPHIAKGVTARARHEIAAFGSLNHHVAVRALLGAAICADCANSAEQRVNVAASLGGGLGARQGGVSASKAVCAHVANATRAWNAGCAGSGGGTCVERDIAAAHKRRAAARLWVQTMSR
jgi:hypothetical protein